MDNQALIDALRGRIRELEAENGSLRQALEPGAGVGTNLRQIIDLVPHMIFAKDRDGRFLLANRAVAEPYGMSVTELVGRLHRDVHPEAAEVDRMLADDRAVIDSGRPKVISEEPYLDARGRRRILHTVKLPYRTAESDLPAVLGVAIDITEQRAVDDALRSSEDKYRAIMENASDAIFVADLDGNLIDANREAERLFGYTRQEFLSMHASRLHPPEEEPNLRAAFHDITTKGHSLYEHKVVRKDGGIRVVEVAGTAIRYGGGRVALGVFRDITRRVHEEQLRLAREKSHRETLVREVHHRIKNNLQGVVGLLRQHAGAQPKVGDAIAAAISQVQSIAVVYGLYGQADGRRVRLHEMVAAIVDNARALAGAPLRGPEATGGPALVLAPDEAVPVALVVNELVLNAVKHGRGAVAVALEAACVDGIATADIRVSNAGSLPGDFQFPGGNGLGTGLGLVKSLLPREGAALSIARGEAEVVADLKLRWPVIAPEDTSDDNAD